VDRRTNALIVRGSPHVLQVTGDLVAVLDTPPGSPLPPVKSLRGLRLKSAGSREVADILRHLNIPNARVVALEKSNLLIVMAPDADLKEIGELVKDLDVEAKGPPADKR
jgi:type II secretory pathway component GspD/PulD (secretin)